MDLKSKEDAKIQLNAVNLVKDVKPSEVNAPDVKAPEVEAPGIKSSEINPNVFKRIRRWHFIPLNLRPL